MARIPVFSSIVINSINQTSAIASSIVSFNYTDLFSAGASTLELEVLSNSPVMPTVGQFIEIKFKYQDGGAEGTTGTMRVDDFVRGYRPDTIKIGAIAWDYGSSGWSSGGRIFYGNSSLQAIVADNATRLGLTGSYQPSPLPSGLIIGSTGTISAAPENGVSVSTTESRFALLKQIADEYGYAFQAKGGFLFFRSIELVRQQSAIATLTTSDISPGCTFRQKASGLIRQCLVTTRSGTTTTYTDSSVPTAIGTALTIDGRYFENLTATSAIAFGQFVKANADQFSAQLRMAGNPLLTAGSVINLLNFATPQNRRWLITKASHSISPSGFLTGLDMVGV
jgi:phage protein D